MIIILMISIRVILNPGNTIWVAVLFCFSRGHVHIHQN